VTRDILSRFFFRAEEGKKDDRTVATVAQIFIFPLERPNAFGERERNTPPAAERASLGRTTKKRVSSRATRFSHLTPSLTFEPPPVTSLSS
jgi:hypothetical protein